MPECSGASGRRRGQAADRLPPEPRMRGDSRIDAAHRELLLEIADDEVAPLGGEPLGQPPDRQAGGMETHLVSKRASSPSAMAVNERYAWRSAAIPPGRKA